jgi:hypothetical protein
MQWYHWVLIVAGGLFIAIVYLLNRRATVARHSEDEQKKDIYPMW